MTKVSKEIYWPFTFNILTTKIDFVIYCRVPLFFTVNFKQSLDQTFRVECGYTNSKGDKISGGIFILVSNKWRKKSYFPAWKWYFVTKIVLLKLEAEGREFAKCLRSLEQFIQTVKGQNNFWWQNAFLTCSWIYLRSNKLQQL